MTDEDLAAPYCLPDPGNHPGTIAARVLQMPEHRHLVENEIEIDWLMRVGEKVKHGRRVLGSVHEPTVQGEFRDMFEWLLRGLLGRLPAFLVVLDDEYWRKASEREREILVFHELAHIQQKLDRYGAPRFDRDGLPVYGIKGHDVEEFVSVAARYGAHSDDLHALVTAAQRAGDQ